MARRKSTAALVAALMWPAASPVAAHDATCARAETLASYPAPAFLENLTVEPAGRVLFTSYLDQQIMAYRAGESAATFARLDVHPISILPLDSGWLVAAHRQPFTAGPAFVTSNIFLVLDANGAVVRTMAAPDARFLNGMMQMPGGNVLVADSLLGRIWQLDPQTGALTVWLDDPVLAADAAGKDVRPGANGLKLHAGEVFVSNSFSGSIHAVAIGADERPAGPTRLVVSPGKVDDFVVAADGSIYLATHSDTVLRAAPDGTLTTVLPSGGDGSTAVAFTSPDQNALYVLTTGGLLEGAGRPARLLKVDLPGGDKLCR